MAHCCAVSHKFFFFFVLGWTLRQVFVRLRLLIRFGLMWFDVVLDGKMGKKMSAGMFSLRFGVEIESGA
jgi:hypothetical protein